MTDRARFPKFYAASVAARLALLRERGLLSAAEHDMLGRGAQVLSTAAADKMVENVIGVFGLPLGLGLNFLVNGKDVIVPMAVEEPSIVAAVSGAAKLTRAGGGFTAEAAPPLLIGQIQIVDVPHPVRAQATLLQQRDAIVNLANSLHPKMVARGGGCRDVEVRVHPAAGSRGEMLVVHLLVDTCDAMGANLVNTMCEGTAALLEQLSGGRVFLRILSNLTDRALVRARCRIAPGLLAVRDHAGEEVRDGIVLANDFALVDPYRATTHNKGIMNGIDAVALATGNDWRAVEAAAHAYAGRGQSYTALTQWAVAPDGALVGEICLPLKVGTVGGNLDCNPAVVLAHRLLDVGSARELAQVMAAVGLAQNFAALRALATDGIQQGHMTLHARSVAMSAGATPEMFDAVVDQLVAGGEIKVWRAREIMAGMAAAAAAPLEASARGAAGCSGGRTAEAEAGAAHGKVVLLGEHAVVYGHHALAAPLPLAVRARVEEIGGDRVELLIPPWGVEGVLRPGDPHHSLHASLALILGQLGLTGRGLRLTVTPSVPRAMGLGGSAALAVAVIRALSAQFGLGLTEEAVNALAFASERLAHGTPSGVDNTLATYGQLMLFRGGASPVRRVLQVPQPVDIVIGLSGVESLTARMVAQVGRAHAKSPALYGRLFAEMDALTLAATDALEAGDWHGVGELMNVGQGLLNALQVSTWELEELVGIARAHGAVGAKLTGSGGGGSIVALCPQGGAAVADAIRAGGYRALITRVG